MKNYLKYTGLVFSIIIILSLIINLFYYYNLLNNLVYKVILIISIILTVAISAFLLGKKTSSKGYLEGLKFGSFISLIMFSFSLIFFQNIEINMIIYYLIIIFTSIIFSTIGINYKNSN